MERIVFCGNWDKYGKSIGISIREFTCKCDGLNNDCTHEEMFDNETTKDNIIEKYKIIF